VTALVAPVTDDTAPVPVLPALVDVPPSPARRASSRQAIVVVAAAGALFLVVLWVFEGPMAHVWYQSRQQNLAADFTAQRQQDRKGQATAILQIPQINLDLVVVQGDGPAQLRSGPGHRIGTPPAGATGNSLIFGHRNGWGGAFAGLSKLQKKDNIVVSNRTPLRGSPSNLPVLFQVISVQRVKASDTRLLAPSTDHRLTLVTSTGGHFSSERLIVVAVSGAQGHLITTAGRPPANSPHGSELFNATTGLLVLLVGAGVLLVALLRGSHRLSMVVVMVAPVALAALLAVLLEVDLWAFPPLR
jgi:sortase A